MSLSLTDVIEMIVIAILAITNVATYYLLYQEKRRCIMCQRDITGQMRKIQVQSAEIEQLAKVVRAQSAQVEQRESMAAEMETTHEILIRKTREVAERVAQIKQAQADLQATLQKTQETLQQKEKRIALQEELLNLQARQISNQAENVVQLLPYKMSRKGRGTPTLRQAKSRDISSSTGNNAAP
jgi:predicted RNase H-like nuclease (RuvC/YqgF family)